MEEIRKLDDSLDKGVLPKLAQLEITANALHDDYLLGFTYYYYSFATYYFDQDRSTFTLYLSLAVHYLRKIEDHEMLARVYNLVAIDTYSYGSYDVAYNYYRNAHQEAEAMGNTAFLIVIETNLSLLFLELRDFKKAKEYIKCAIRRLSEYSKKDAKLFQLHAAYVDEAAIALEEENYTAAKRALAKAVKSMAKANAPDEDLRISLTLIRLRLACVEGNRDEEETLAGKLITYLKAEPYPEGYAGDVRNLCRWLIANDRLDLAGRILGAVSDRMLSSEMAHVIQMFSTLKVNYAVASGDKKALKESLAEQQVYLQKHRSNLNRIHSYTMELIELDNRIRTEQLLTREEHDRLEKKAYHDALTGLANRYMLHSLMDSAFARAQKERRIIGVGILDIDFFKQYNDTFGHLEGDKCLMAFASELECLCEQEFPSDASLFCGRYGGDEFMVIFDGLKEEEIRALAVQLGEQIRALGLPHPGNPEGIVTISQGICYGIPKEGQRIWDYFSKADAALYEVKGKRGSDASVSDGILLCAHSEDAGEESKEHAS